LVFVYSYFAKITDGVISAEEKETIIEKLSEWLDEEDATGKDKTKTNEKFKLGFAEFEKDPHIERFRFALENIRRHFFIFYDGDAEKTIAQLRNVMRDLYAIAESDSGKSEYAISDQERALLDEIDELWGTGDNHEEEDSGDVEYGEDEDAKDDYSDLEEDGDEEYDEDNVEKGYAEFLVDNSKDPKKNKIRRDYLMKWQIPSSFYNERLGINANIPEWIADLDNDKCCPKFTASQLDKIAKIVERNKIIPILGYAPSPFFDQVKQVWWIVPFSIYREDHASWLMADKNGIYAAYNDDNNIRGIISWENVVDIDFEEAYDDDNNVNMMTVHLGNGGYITLSEFHDENQGSYLKVLFSIYKVRKNTIDASKGKSSWKEGSGGEGFKQIKAPMDLLNEKIWLENPTRPDPRFFS
jgi:hypothetical protein